MAGERRVRPVRPRPRRLAASPCAAIHPSEERRRRAEGDICSLRECPNYSSSFSHSGFGLGGICGVSHECETAALVCVFFSPINCCFVRPVPSHRRKNNNCVAGGCEPVIRSRRQHERRRRCVFFFHPPFFVLTFLGCCFCVVFLYFAKVLGVAIVQLADAQEESPQGISDK